MHRALKSRKLRLRYPNKAVTLIEQSPQQNYSKVCLHYYGYATVHDKKNGLSHSDGDSLLQMLRDCAWAPSSGKDGIDQHY